MDMEAYGNNLSSFIVGGYISSAISLGRDLGLFRALQELDKSVSSQELADRCSLKERYVREWLGCMVATKIVSLDADDHYFIPEECKPGLKALGFAFLFPVMGAMMNSAKECFRKDGPRGYGYSDMPPEITEILDERIGDGSMIVAQIADPVMNLKVSVSKILDLGCGGGGLSRAISRRFPDADVYGIDYTECSINTAIAKAKTENMKNIKHLKMSAADMPQDWANTFDWVVMYDVLHDLPCPLECIREVKRVLKDDGVASIVDPSVHSKHRDNIGDADLAGAAYAISSLVCLPSSLSTEGAPGNGIGWGIENKEKFLVNAGWCIKERGNIGSEWAYNFTCVKSE